MNKIIAVGVTLITFIMYVGWVPRVIQFGAPSVFAAGAVLVCAIAWWVTIKSLGSKDDRIMNRTKLNQLMAPYELFISCYGMVDPLTGKLTKRYTYRLDNYSVLWEVHDGTGFAMPEHYHGDNYDTWGEAYQAGIEHALKLKAKLS